MDDVNPGNCGISGSELSIRGSATLRKTLFRDRYIHQGSRLPEMAGLQPENCSGNVFVFMGLWLGIFYLTRFRKYRKCD